MIKYAWWLVVSTEHSKIVIGVPVAKLFGETVYCGEVTRINDHVRVEYDDGDGNTVYSFSQLINHNTAYIPTKIQ